MTDNRGGPRSDERGPEEEPITIVDRRKVDPSDYSNDEGDAASFEGEVADPTVPGAAEGAAAADPGEGLADSISTELAERTADLQRLTAEYANYRRRVERDRQAATESAKAAVVGDLLGVLDDLERARAHGDLDSGPLKSVADKLVDALTKQGLEEFGAEGEPFDPTLHEAVQHEGEGNDPVLGVVMRKGYRLGDRVLRHALVGVTDGVADLADTPDAANAGKSSAGNGPGGNSGAGKHADGTA